jgi:hypothetical protein
VINEREVNIAVKDNLILEPVKSRIQGKWVKFILELALPPNATILPRAWNPTRPGHTPKSVEPPNGPDGRAHG